jgi:exoribonuclease R
MYCHELNCSIKKFTNTAIKKVSEYSCDLPFREARVFTIDGPDSVDLDDGLSIDSEKISVYISLVPYVIDKLDLWDCFTKRISNIYMPDKRHNMLPSVISSLCSLNENWERACLVLDFYFTGLTELSVCKVRVSKNFSYDETSLLEDEDYKRILGLSFCTNSHELIQFYMIKFNAYCGSLSKKGLFTVSVKPNEVPHSLLPVYYKQYSRYEYAGEYLQITSPIRRLVDIINMYHLCIQQNLLEFKGGSSFCEKWYTSIDYLNESLKSVRKAQNQAKMLDISIKEQNKTFGAVLFEKVAIDKDKLFKYKIYIPELKLTSTVKTEMDFDNFIERDVKLYLFQDEKRLKKKIKFCLAHPIIF